MSTKTVVAVATASSPRGKKRSASILSSGDETKKTRGRPRVEPQDETAADRRRTQIRLAQRSYRQRKEGTITELQSKVSQLEFIINEMNDTCQDLSRNALKSGQASSEHGFSHKLAEAAERFMELTRSVKRQKLGQHASSDESSSDPTDKSSSPPEMPNKRSPLVAASKKSVSHEAKRPAPTIVSANERGIPSVWGYETVLPTPVEFPAQRNVAPATSQELAPVTLLQPEYPAPNSFESNNFYQQPLGPPAAMNYHMFAFNPGAEITLPMSYAHLEINFGRRLSRFITEAGVRLLSMPYPPAKRVREVFGHVMQYYGQQQLRDLLVESLRLPPNQPIETKAIYPYAGPLTSQIWSVQTLDDKARSDILSKEDNKDDGAWFLPNDVEGFLQTKGINIPFGASFANWEFEEFVPIQNLAPPWPSPAASNNGDAPTNYDGTVIPLDQLAPDYPSVTSVQSQPLLPITGAPGHVTQTMTVSSNGMIPYTISQSNPVYTSNFITHDASAMAPKAQLVPQRYTIDVHKLMSDLQKATQCLGKTPGFRRRDVEAALQESLMPMGVVA